MKAWLGSLLVVFGSASAQTIGSCPVLPANNIWNTAIDQMPVRPDSATLVNTIGAAKPLHPDFGSGLYDGGPIGIPYVLVANQARVPVRFTYASESDPGPYPIPATAPIEGGSNSTGDRHVLVVDQGGCMLYELWSAYPQSDGSWNAGSGAIFDLRSNQLRPDTWTSADAAGLPVLPGLLRYDEVLVGEIKHAIRFTAPQTRNQYVWPARHYASSLTAAAYPPMGQRFRLRADFDVSKFSAANQVILRALKKYGIILADNGSSWYLSGSPDSRWNNDDLHALAGITGSAFEAVDVSQLMVDRNSGQAGPSGSAALAITGVLNAASFQGAISTGAWISIFGTNLAATTRPWRSDEIVGGKLPTQLDGVGVSVGGAAAALHQPDAVECPGARRDLRHFHPDSGDLPGGLCYLLIEHPDIGAGPLPLRSRWPPLCRRAARRLFHGWYAGALPGLHASPAQRDDHSVWHRLRADDAVPSLRVRGDTAGLAAGSGHGAHRRVGRRRRVGGDGAGRRVPVQRDHSRKCA